MPSLNKNCHLFSLISENTHPKLEFTSHYPVILHIQGNTMTKDDKYLNLIEGQTFNPIFILGLHRSGTSILYSMLGKTECFNLVTAYHLICYDDLLHNYVNGEEDNAKKSLDEYMRKIGIEKRKIDDLIVRYDFPEEYGFLLTYLNYPCGIKDKNIKIFQELCAKIQFISNKDKPLLLKNPYDFDRFIYIKKRFPAAKFVFIHRDPMSVSNSSMSAVDNLFKEKNPYTALLSRRYANSFKYPLLHKLSELYFSISRPLFIRAMVATMNKRVKYYADNIKKMNPADYISISYDNLCAEPNLIMTRVMDFLGMKTDVDFSTYIKPRDLKFSSDILKRRKLITRKMEKYSGLLFDEK